MAPPFERRNVGKYALVSLLGEGGAANTYLALDEAAGQRYAIKELRLIKSSNQKQIELFERECATLRELDHPQIPRFIDNVVERRAETISLYLVQELIEGQSLQQHLDRGDRFGAHDVVTLMRSCLEPLAYLHARTPPLYHRDIKPSNIIRRPDGSCVLVDFGAVREAVIDTRTGGSSVVGTFGYMAPEQFQARAFASTDLYGVGATALHLLTGMEPGRFPLRRLKPDLHAVLDTDPHLAAILDILLEPAAEDRYASALQLRAALDRWLGTHGPGAAAPLPSAVAADAAPSLTVVVSVDAALPAPATPSEGSAAPSGGSTASYAGRLESTASGALAPPPPPAGSDAGMAAAAEPSAPRLTAADLPPLHVTLDAAAPLVAELAAAASAPNVVPGGAAASPSTAGGPPTSGRVAVVQRTASLAEALWPSGQGAPVAGRAVVAVGGGIALYGAFGPLQYNAAAVIWAGLIVAGYGALLWLVPRARPGRVSEGAARGPVVDVEVSRVVRRLGAFGSIEWHVEFAVSGPDELHYANTARLPSAQVARDIAIDPSVLRARYDEHDPGASVVVLRK